MQPGNQVEADGESLPPIAITLRQNAEDFQATDHVLDHDPAPRQLSVTLFLLVGQFRFARLLLRRPALCMEL